MKKNIKLYLIMITGLISFFGFLSFLYPYLLFSENTKRFYAPIRDVFGSPGMWFIWVAYFANLIFLMQSGGKKQWQAKGIYLAFVISLFTEMFGWGFMVYLFSPFFNYPVLTVTHINKTWILPQIIGAYLILMGMILIIIGWKSIYNSKGLVTFGIYRFMRHPQYLGFILVATGLLFFWITALNLFLYPFLVAVYIMQTHREDKEMQKEYGLEYTNYKNATPAFIPKIIFLKKNIS